ncbi:MAG: TauD/TfdA family dioxygenase [Polyangiaceae bacterium]|nr:TauD/TfdA family dioxygenase [Polyangiaceae bacterium]
MARTYKTVTGQALHFLLRPHEGAPRGPIRSEAAWKAADLARKSDLIVQLDGAEIAELEAAARAARATGKPLGALTAADFPLPTFGAKLARFRRAVSLGVGVQVMRGVPIDRWSVDDSERFFWCFGQHLGTAGAQNRDGELLGHVRDEGLSYDDPTVRGYRTSAKLDYHCDAADAVGLLCLRTAKSGGMSRFVSSVTVFNELIAARPDLAARLFEPMAFDSRGDGGVDYFMIAPCRYAGGALKTFYHADYFRTAERQPGAPKLSAELRELFDTYDAIASSEDNRFEMELAPGDVQLLSNHTVLHSRSAYEDHAEPEKKRHLLRLWLSFDRPRSLRALPSLGLEAARLLRALGAGRLRKRLYGARARASAP